MTDKSESVEAARAPEKSIKRRIARLILVPGVAALVLWLATSTYLVFNGYYDREVANGVRKVSIPAVRTLAAIQRERRESIDYLSHAAKDLPKLIAERQQTDSLVEKLRSAAGSVLSKAPRSIDVRWAAFSDRLDRLPGIRSTIDSGRAGRQQTTEFYDELVNAAIELFDTQARVVPDATATQGGITATDTFRAGDLMARASSVISSGFGSRGLASEDHLQFVKMVGAYHATLDAAVPHLHPDARAEYNRMAATPEWTSLVTAENALITAGPWKTRAPRTLQLNAEQWDTVTNAIAEQLVSLTVTQADRTSSDALRTGNNQLLAAAIGSAVALLIALGAIISAVRQSQVLVNRALSVRLAQLGQDAVTVVDERLPSIIAKLRRREKVDLGVELPHRDYGRDEIGDLATVLNRSMRAAVDAAVEEATTRAAGMAMLMGVARRPQRPLQHGLKVIEDLQNRIGDEQILGELFDINHQLTQTRRFLENLIILAGGQAGRRFPRPVPVRRVLLGAVAETRQYQRVTLRRTPEIAISGASIAGITHLVAELLDNALVFSPPESEVWMSCTQAHNGVVIEIEDAGVGMPPEAMEAANVLLATAPTPDLSGLKGGAQIGLWVVAELAKRGNMQVTLRTSAYGGVLAVVLLPASAIASGEDLRRITNEPGDERRTLTVDPFDELGEDGPQAVTVPASRDRSAAAPAASNGTHGARQSLAQERTAPHPTVGTPATAPTASPTAPSAPSGGQAAPGIWPPPPGAPTSAPTAPHPAPSGLPGAHNGRPTAGVSSPASTGQQAGTGHPGAGQQAGAGHPGTDLPARAGHAGTGLPAGTGHAGAGQWTGSGQQAGVPGRQSGAPTEARAETTEPAASAAGGPTRPPLPQRRPQENLAHQLKEQPLESQATGPAHSPETARNRLASYQQGWRAGRTGDLNLPSGAPGGTTPPGHRTGDITPPTGTPGIAPPPSQRTGDPGLARRGTGDLVPPGHTAHAAPSPNRHASDTPAPHRGTATPYNGTASTRTSSALPHSGTIPHSSSAPPHSGTIPHNDGTVPPHGGTASPHGGTVPPHGGTASPHGGDVPSDGGDVPPGRRSE